MDAMLGKAVLGKAIIAGTLPESRSDCVGMRPAQASSSSSQGAKGLQDDVLSAPTSRSIFTGPLEFLWFAKQKDAQTIELSDVGWESQPEETGSVQSGATSSEESSRKSWVYTIWGLRSMLAEKPSMPHEAMSEDGSSEITAEENSEEVLVPVADGGEVSKEGSVCSECKMEGCLVDDSSMLEVPHVPVAHDKQSFANFLHGLRLPELKVISRMAHLCNLAYAIPQIKPSELLTYHQLRFVTSSLKQKAEALDKEQPADKNSEGDKPCQKFPLNAASAYALASAVASYVHSHTKGLLQLKKNGESSQSKVQDENVEEAAGESMAGGIRRPTPHYDSEDVASMIASSPMTAVVAAKEGTRDAVAKDLQSLHNCPCEWYSCDDSQNLTRYFVIQGSESLPSWQANLLFEPTSFEDSRLGVLVHRGIYEAAKGLYEQILPHVVEHLQEHGESAKFGFTGHSLGGSLGTLVSLMLLIRGVVRRESLLPVYTFGSPCIMCGGDFLLDKLGLPRGHVRSVMLHRDIVPRTFACDYPDHVAEVLKRLNGSFREHPCLNNQRLLYAPMGEFLILQPGEEDAPGHPLLPSGLGLYSMRHPQSTGTDRKQEVELRAAQRAFLNSPHPLEILSDRTAYGSEGTISRDHDPRSYMKTINKVYREEARKVRRLRRDQRRRLWWPVLGADFSLVMDSGSSSNSNQAQDSLSSSSSCTEETEASIGSKPGFQHTQMVLLFFLSAKVLLTEGFAAFFAWV